MSDDDVRIMIAWLLDRAEQYRNSSCCRCVFDQLVEGLRDGEPTNAFLHGELDDLWERVDRIMTGAT